MTRRFADAGELADALVERVGRKVVFGLPVGLGKAIRVANALYARALADPALELTVFTALVLEPPRARNDLELVFSSRWPNACTPAGRR